MGIPPGKSFDTPAKALNFLALPINVKANFTVPSCSQLSAER